MKNNISDILKKKKTIKIILWDFGGVLSTSPLHNFYEYEKKNNIPLGTLIKINSHNKFNNAWAKLEKNLINKNEFTKLYLKEANDLNINSKLNVEKILECLNVELNPEMKNFFLKLKKKIPCACLTNNISENISHNEKNIFKNFKKNFSHVFESSKIGLRKPEVEIYKYVLNKLSIPAKNILFIDDLGINLKPARMLGMNTYKMENTKSLIIFLQKLLEL